MDTMNSATSSRSLLPGGEVGAFSPLDAFARLRSHGRRLIFATILAGLVGTAASWLVAAEFESEVDLQVGSVQGQLIENTAVLAEHLESEGMRRALEVELGFPLPLRAVRVEAVGAADGGASAYLRVVAKYHSAERAQTLAQHVAAFVDTRHAQTFEQVSKDQAAFQARLNEGLTRLDADVSAIQQRLTQVANEQNAMASLLLQSNLATARTQQLELRKQLRDAQVAQTLGTRPTRTLGPATEPRTPVWPKRVTFALVAASLGFALAAAVSLMQRR